MNATAIAVPPTKSLESVLSEIRIRKTEFSNLTYVPKDVVEKLKQIGVYRAFVPKSLGGDELSPAQFCKLIEKISAADASTGWVASFGVSAMYLASLPEETFKQIYGKNPDTVFAGAIFPPQVARETDGGYLVNGRWPYCSGCMGADYIGAGIRVEGSGATSSLPRMAVMPRNQVDIKHTWDTSGLTATGSHDIEIKDIVVSPDWTFVRGAAHGRSEPLFHYPAMAIAAQVLAVVALGTAREALDWIHREAAEKASITGAPSIGNRPHVQAQLGKAEARLRSARAFFYETIEEGYREVCEKGEVASTELKVRLRLCATNAAQEGAEVARMAYFMGGTSAIQSEHLLSRCMIDSSAVAQHAFLGFGTWTLAGSAMLEQGTIPGYP